MIICIKSFALLLCLAKACFSTLTVKPSFNTAAPPPCGPAVDVTLRCVTDITNALVFWQLARQSDGVVVSIFRGNVVSNANYYELIGDKNTEYSLKIKLLNESTVGTYTCTDNGGIGESVNAVVTCKTTEITDIPFDLRSLQKNCGVFERWYQAVVAFSTFGATLAIIFLVVFVVDYYLSKRITPTLYYVFGVVISLIAIALIVGSSVSLSRSYGLKELGKFDSTVLAISIFIFIFVLIHLVVFHHSKKSRNICGIIICAILSFLIFLACLIYACITIQKYCDAWSWQIFLIVCIATKIIAIICILMWWIRSSANASGFNNIKVNNPVVSNNYGVDQNMTPNNENTNTVINENFEGYYNKISLEQLPPKSENYETPIVSITSEPN